jgi:hypothetical protein
VSADWFFAEQHLRHCGKLGVHVNQGPILKAFATGRAAAAGQTLGSMMRPRRRGALRHAVENQMWKMDNARVFRN